MQPQRLEEILTLLQDPTLKVKLSKEPTTMGPGYISGKAVEIAEAKERINSLGEEIEIAISQAETTLGDYQEQMDVRLDLAITGLLPDETEGMDATARKALAKQKAELSWLTEQANSAGTQGRQLPLGFSLRSEIHRLDTWVKQMKMVHNIIDNRRQDLTRLDSTLRLQVTSLQVEAGLFGRRISGSPRNGFTGESPRPPKDDSILEGIEPGLTGTDSFQNLLDDAPIDNSMVSPPP